MAIVLNLTPHARPEPAPPEPTGAPRAESKQETPVSARDDQADVVRLSAVARERRPERADTPRADERAAMDAVSFLQARGEELEATGNILGRMRELAKAATQVGEDDRAGLTEEFESLQRALPRPKPAEERPAATKTAVAVGANGGVRGEAIAITLGDLSVRDVGGMKLGSTTAAWATLDRLDEALSKVNAYRSDFGAIQNRLESAVRNLQNYTENIEAAESRIRDADFAYETAQMAKFQILEQSGTAVLGQANGVSQAALRLLG